jgi:pimeloyl-ACP methyl ester carboxylesterase
MPYAENQGVKVYYEVEGSGVPIVLQHSFTGSLNRWRECGYVDGLSADYRLILIDARGHGKSGKPHDPADYAWEFRARDVLAVMDQLGLRRVNFWGYSLGGIYGFSLAKYAPERLNSLILGGAHPYATSMEVFRGIDGRNPEEFLSAFERFIGERFTPALREKMLNNDLEALAASAGDRPSWEEILPTCAVPCLLYVGAKDPRLALVRRCAEQIPRAVFVSISGCNHAETNAASHLVLPHALQFLEQNASLLEDTNLASQ